MKHKNEYSNRHVNSATRRIIKLKMAYAIFDVDCCRLSFCFSLSLPLSRLMLVAFDAFVLIEYTTDKKKHAAVILYQLHPFIAPNRSPIFYAELKK